MHSSTFLKALIALAVASVIKAAPWQMRDDDSEAETIDFPSAEDQPLLQLQIHPNNRTDLVSGLFFVLWRRIADAEPLECSVSWVDLARTRRELYARRYRVQLHFA